jgi:hypothetical protein
MDNKLHPSVTVSHVLCRDPVGVLRQIIFLQKDVKYKANYTYLSNLKKIVHVFADNTLIKILRVI